MSTASWPRASTRSNERPGVDLATLSTGISPLEVSLTNNNDKVTDVSWLPNVKDDDDKWKQKEIPTKDPVNFETQGNMLGATSCWSFILQDISSWILKD